ncbi:MAG: nitrogenase component 1 [Treponema sp.]|jgi:nitrogenase molybdenum-iron protein alpha chain|nr:nitrogenase component 1 [Treponema sp.]
MDYLSLKEAPKREDRVHTCITYGGTLCGLQKRLGEGGGCFRDGSREFSQGSLCLLLPALAIINSFPDNVIIMHAAVGCGSCLQSQNGGARSGNMLRTGKIKDSIWVSTSLNETDVISGGEKKLRQAIVEVDQLYSPKTITIVTGCVPGIIGDDVDGIVEDLRSRVTAVLIPIHCEGFKTKTWATAYDAIYHGLGKNLLQDPARRDRVVTDELEEARFEYLKKRRVNLCNLSSMGRIDELELTRLLNALDLDVNIVPLFKDSEQMYSVKYAALSVSTCPTHDDYFLKFLNERFGIPYLFQHIPIGIENTTSWIRAVAPFFGKEAAAEQLIHYETALLEEALKPYREFFKGKTAFVSAGEFRSIATAYLLHELGFTIVGVRPFHYDAFAEKEFEKLKNAAGDIPLNIANVQPFEEANLLRSLKPDLFMGHSHGNATAAKLGIPVHTIFNSSCSYIGFRGVFEIARRVYRQLSNPSLNRKFPKYIKLPYKESWYQENPFKYIKDSKDES